MALKLFIRVAISTTWVWGQTMVSCSNSLSGKLVVTRANRVIGFTR